MGRRAPPKKTISTRIATKKVTIPIEGMYCGGCATSVKYSVSKLAGVVDVKASYKAGLAIVEYDSHQVTVAQMVAAINKIGYQAKEPQ